MEISEDETGSRKAIARENIRPEVLASLKSFPKVFRNACVRFRVQKIIYKELGCTVSRTRLTKAKFKNTFCSRDWLLLDCSGFQHSKCRDDRERVVTMVITSVE